MSIDEAINALEKAEANNGYSKELAQWLQEFEMDLEAVITNALETVDELKACECGKVKR